MEKETSLQPTDLPPSLEKALQEAFTKGALISEPDAARVIGISTTTLRREAVSGKIENTRRGTRRAYTIEALRDYLAPIEPLKSDPQRETANVSRRRSASAAAENHQASRRLDALAAKLRVKKRQAYARRVDDEGKGR
ncbi:hypothetical protein GCM10011390_50450 [Aureimonas endophytica]|uniref:Helix-turn-helix domain-containing protein n=1 Tax=Aureimonas endophytica TaxID=2027858 RepID=A0A917A3M5_9HYPH|nr:hypothetical protein [Aureimonas endophytica]GGE24915.1 hypothetical protein GCM10011390_50450 [Aureimonas endophytica]